LRWEIGNRSEPAQGSRRGLVVAATVTMDAGAKSSGGGGEGNMAVKETCVNSYKIRSKLREKKERDFATAERTT
jgi:hypothetical protein